MQFKKVCLGLCLALIATTSFAISVSVKSNASHLDGIGFTVNGKDHGGMGTSYEESNLPKGMYTFGVRSNGKDIGCNDKHGKKSFKLTHNTHAMLDFNGHSCLFKINR